MRTPFLPRLLQLLLASVIASLAGCVIPDPSSPGPQTAPAPVQVSAPEPAPDRVPPPAPPPPEVVAEAPPPLGRVLFYSEPNFRGEYFVVETGAAVENLAQLPRQGGSWSNGIASFRIEGAATVAAYADPYYAGPLLETSISIVDLVAEHRPGSRDATWDHAISSVRVLPPHAHVVAPRYDRRQAEEMVRRAYRDVLGREVDADGLRSYRDKLIAGGWSEEILRTDLRRSPEFRALNPDEIVARAYRDVLKREPDPEGLRHYRDLFVNHGWTIPQLRADLLRSDERSDKRIREIVTRAYRDLLGRDPDPDGFASYQRAILDKGWGESQVRDSLRKSAEYRQKHGG